jgi:hypothetical protein
MLSERFTMENRQYQLLFHFSRSEGESEWQAHCLGLEIVTYGENLAHAVSMGIEAAGLTIADDLNEGLDPLDRTMSDEEINLLMGEVKKGGHESLPLGMVIEREDEFYNVFVMLNVMVQCVAKNFSAPIDIKPNLNVSVMQRVA